MNDAKQYEIGAVIPNTQYIRINDKVRQVAGESTWFYRDNNIVFRRSYPVKTFEQILSAYPFVTALHCMSSQTPGKWRKIGVPSTTPGVHIWGRAEMPYNVGSPWVYIKAESEPDDAARYCAEEVMDAFCGLQTREMLDYFDKIIKTTPRYQLEEMLHKAAKEYFIKSI